MRKIIIPVAAAGLAAAALPAGAAADERVCRGALGAISVDNLRVPQGASCALTGTRIQGTVKVERGAALRASRIRVIGNVQGEGARWVNVYRSRIGGSYQLVQGRGSRLSASVVGGDVQLFENRGASTVLRTTIDGNLQCKENAPRPAGGRNVVEGNKEDQCARL
jgi:hypothetical protein